MVNESADGQHVDRPRRPGLIAVLCAPIVGVFRVSRATALLTRAGPIQLALLLLGYMAIEASLCVTMAVWDDTLRYDYSNPTTQMGVRRISATQPWWGGNWQVESRSMPEVWGEWEARGRRNPAPPIFMGVGCAVLASVLVCIALFWPRVHRHGRLSPTLRRTYAAVLASCGRAIVFTTIVFTAYVLLRHWRMRNGLRWEPGLEEGHLAVVGIQLSLIGMLATISRAVRAACDANYAADPPPQCEGCGYDLTHRPESGVCPECGLSVDRSLEQGMGRRPAEFERDPSLVEGISTSVDALFSPAMFYRRLAMRMEPQRDANFRLRHHVTMFCCAIVWMVILISTSMHGSWGWDETAGMIAGSLGATIAGWLLLHALGAVACLVWVVKRTLPDLRRGVRVVNFEVVFLWLFCLFNGMMITSFIWFDDWIGVLLGTFNRPTGLPHAVLAMFIPNVILMGYWFMRLLRNGRAVQWANY